jgi:hypothetical protein
MVDYIPGFGTSAFRTVIDQWAQFGVFDILLPLLLVFTLVFAILEKINIFHNRGVNVVISLVIGFFSVTNPYVSVFFMYLFSNIAIGIAVLLVMIVLLGVSLKPDTSSWQWIFGIAGGILLLIAITKAGFLQYVFGTGGMAFLQQNSAAIILILIVGLLIVGVIFGAKGFQKKTEIRQS